jgi:hypothetical protein
MEGLYIKPVPKHIINEIGKRGLYEHRQDANGVVTPRKKSKGSLFGWGCVDDTIPTASKDVKWVRRNLDIILAQKVTRVIETAKGNKRPLEVAIPTPEESQKKQVKTPGIIEQWYAECEHNYANGAIGLVPEPYRDEFPQKEELLQTNVGKVLLSFVDFFRKRYF